jgi:hypothetical protein
MKRHRFITLCFLLKHNLIKKTDWSFIENNFLLNDTQPNKEDLLNYLDNYSNEFINEGEFLSSQKYIKNYHESTFTEQSYLTDFMVPDTFLDSYINIVTETHFTETDVHISEKSYKPFYFYQLPLLIATPGHVKKMKELFNYDFFDDLINHSYDNEPDNQKRLNMIFNEILRLYENEANVIEFYRKNKERFELNKFKTQELIKINQSNYFYNI